MHRRISSRLKSESAAAFLDVPVDSCSFSAESRCSRWRSNRRSSCVVGKSASLRRQRCSQCDHIPPYMKDVIPICTGSPFVCHVGISWSCLKTNSSSFPRPVDSVRSCFLNASRQNPATRSAFQWNPCCVALLVRCGTEHHSSAAFLAPYRANRAAIQTAGSYGFKFLEATSCKESKTRADRRCMHVPLPPQLNGCSSLVFRIWLFWHFRSNGLYSTRAR